MFERFFHSEVSGSIVLLISAVVAIVWANSPWAPSYEELVHTYVGISWGDHSFNLSLGHWIGDGLMAIFFFVIGLEIKREVVVGQLSTFRKAILPVTAAFGGALIPAAIYAFLNFGAPSSSGWGIPMATDIAFALGVLALFGKRVPIGLKIFLTALAIADDLIAVLVIAFFYTAQLSVPALLAAGGFLFLIFGAGRLGLRATWIYVLLGIGAWAAVLASGVHATIAGILIAMLVPVSSSLDPNEFLNRIKRNFLKLETGNLTATSPIRDRSQKAALDDIYQAADDMRPPGLSLESQLHPFQAFLILPLFALFKAGVPITGESISHLGNGLGMGIILGLIVGKQIGIVLFTWLIIKSGQAEMPEGVNLAQFWGVACLGGIGFTMSIFISELAFTDHLLVEEAKLSILIASLVSGIIGYIILSRTLPRSAQE
jgi:NhaA family Na+:H+ antiporter